MKRAFVSSITPFNENPSDFSRVKYTRENKLRADNYFKSVEPCAACGLIFDCVEGVELQRENVGYCDGEFIWTSQDVYHFEKYDAAVTDDFMTHISFYQGRKMEYHKTETPSGEGDPADRALQKAASGQRGLGAVPLR